MVTDELPLLLEQWALDIDRDGTPSQAGPSVEELHQLAQSLRASLQAMQARAENAERERDAFRDMADGYGKLDAELAIAEARVKELEAKIALIEEEAEKDNSCLGRSDSLALRNIRTALKGDKNG